MTHAIALATIAIALWCAIAITPITISLSL